MHKCVFSWTLLPQTLDDVEGVVTTTYLFTYLFYVQAVFNVINFI